jgi:four helix bundle protein
MEIYKVSAAFPKEEMYGLTSQLRRASVSIPANIAEGCGRSSDAELAHFLHISLGSTSEVDYYLLLVRDLGWIKPEDYQRLSEEIDEIRRMLISFIKKVRNTKQ